jgi:hypothetical protein
MALKISFYFMPKFWLNMVVDDSQVSNVRKLKGKLLLYIYIKGPFSLQNTFGVSDFLQKKN